ncbi:MAG: pilus assembly protein TadG-related protein [Anaerolineae bacterium]
MMQKSLLSRIARSMARGSQSGQTLIILAIGFIMLLAFVGIVTDVSLLFVRYSTLRRATDAAAVAAAGQMRRAVPTADEITKATANCNTSQAAIDNCAFGYAFARNLTNVNLSARQFIEFYGLSPSNIVVNTCATTAKNAADATANNKVYDPDLECDDTQQPRKLVRVIAQIDSPTVFLRLIGWPTITLEASAISETAVLDVVMIFDASESMLNQTSYEDWETIPNIDPITGVTLGSPINLGMRYLPPRVLSGPNITGTPDSADKTTALYQTWAGAGGDWQQAWRTLLTRTQAQIIADNNATTGIPIIPFKRSGSTYTTSNFSDPMNPRAECRVRFFPGAGAIGNIPNGDPNQGFVPADDTRLEYAAYLRSVGVYGGGDQYPSTYDGFIPAYNFYGCCNDPNGDSNFSDLICQPFRKVRDATAKFMDRIDFIRGDRVAFVTFDRAAYLVDPDGNGTALPMMTNQDQAERALRQIIGVRAEPSYYADTNCNGLWDAYVTGGTSFTTDCVNPVSTTGGIPIDYVRTFNRATNSWGANGTGGFDYTNSGNLTDYPVKDSCFLQNAALPYPWSLYSSPANPGNATLGIPYVVSRYPTSFAALYSAGTTVSTQSFMVPES